jgi:hypothetical protein
MKSKVPWGWTSAVKTIEPSPSAVNPWGMITTAQSLYRWPATQAATWLLGRLPTGPVPKEQAKNPSITALYQMGNLLNNLSPENRRFVAGHVAKIAYSGPERAARAMEKIVGVLDWPPDARDRYIQDVLSQQDIGGWITPGRVKEFSQLYRSLYQGMLTDPIGGAYLSPWYQLRFGKEPWATRWPLRYTKPPWGH